MIEDMLRELFKEPTEAEQKANEVIGQICEFNQFNLMGVLLLNNFLGGFDRQIIADKVSPLATPFVLADHKLMH